MTEATVRVRAIFPLTRAAGGGRQLAIQLAASGGEVMDPAALVGRARRLGADGLVVLLPADEAAVAALQAAAGSLPVARGHAPAAAAPTVELFPAGQQTRLLGEPGPGILSEVGGLPLATLAGPAPPTPSAWPSWGRC
ncbi:MAG: hypothetical protein R3F60_22670 [bacterium]